MGIWHAEPGFVLPKRSRSTAKVDPRVANNMTASGATSPAASVVGYRSATTRPPLGEMALTPGPNISGSRI